MRSLLPIAALLLSFAVSRAIPQAPQAAQKPNTGVIEGTFTRAGTSEPIPGVTVQLNIAQAARGAGIALDQTVLDATTDEMGHFIFKELYPGPYQLRYTLDGYFALPDGVQGNGAPVAQPVNGGARGGTVTPIAFAIDAKQPFKLAIQMIPGGVISGRVSDSNSRPITSSQVTALRIAYQDGQRTLNTVKTSTTNDRGEFRIFGLAPDDYYVRSEYRRTSNAATGTQDIFTTYYPGVDDPNSAAPTSVRGGTESSGTNITVRATTGVTVSGTVVVPDSVMPPQAPIPLGARGGTPLVGAMSATTFYLVPPDRAGLHDDTASYSNSVFGTADRTAGKFEIRNVRAGRYEIYTIVRTNPTDSQERHSGHTSINVSNQDLTGVNIVITPGVDLKVRFTSQDATALSQAPTQLNLRSRDGMPAALQQTGRGGARGGARGAPQDDWRIYPGLTEGRYSLDSQLSNLRDVYIADMRQGDSSIYETGTIVIGSGTPEPVELVLARPAGTIDGIVQNVAGKPASGVSVVVIPNGARRENPLLYKRGTSDTDGKVNFRALPPGAYKLFAWENLPSGAELNAEFMRDYEERGIPVTIEAGAQLKVQVPLIPAGKP